MIGSASFEARHRTMLPHRPDGVHLRMRMVMTCTGRDRRPMRIFSP